MRLDFDIYGCNMMHDMLNAKLCNFIFFIEGLTEATL